MHTQMVSQQTGADTFTHAFDVLSTMGLATLATNTFGEGNIDGEGHYSWGSSHHPAYTGDSTIGWQSSTVYDHYDASGSGGSTEGFQREEIWNSPLYSVGPVTYTVAWNDGLRFHAANPSVRSEVQTGGSGGGTYHAFVHWNCEGWTGEFFDTPVTIDTPPAFNRYDAMI